MPTTRSGNANKHPGYIVMPPRQPRRTTAQVEAAKAEKVALDVAAAAAKVTALHAAASLEAERRAADIAEEEQAARPAPALKKKVAHTSSADTDDVWENYHARIKGRVQGAGGRGHGRAGGSNARYSSIHEGRGKAVKVSEPGMLESKDDEPEASKECDSGSESNEGLFLPDEFESQRPFEEEHEDELTQGGDSEPEPNPGQERYDEMARLEQEYVDKCIVEENEEWKDSDEDVFENVETTPPPLPKGRKGKESVRLQVETIVGEVAQEGGGSKRKATTELINTSKKLKVPKPSGLVPDWAKTPAVFGPDPAIKTSAKVAKKVSSKATAKTPSKATTKAATKTRVKAATKASKAVTKHASKETVLEVSDSEPESIDEFGGLPEEVDQTRNRAAAHRQVDSVQSRNTSQQSVKITRTEPLPTESTSNTATKAKVAFKMCDIEPFYREGDVWATVFVPSYIGAVGRHPSPWSPTFNVINVMQEFRDTAYPSTVHILDDKCAVHFVVKQRVAEWRNTFGATALAVVSKAFQDEDEFNSADAVATRIRYLLAGKYPPWLWGNAFVPPMAGTIRKKTCLYQSAFILATFATHFGANGVNTDPVAIGLRPIGALALSITAVQRALHAWQTGRLVLPERKQDWWFSKANWGRDTKRFMEPVNLLDSTRWTSLLKAVKPYTAFAKNDPIDVDMSDDDAGDPRFLCPSSDV